MTHTAAVGTKTSHGLSHTQTVSLSRYSTRTCPEGLTREISTKQHIRTSRYLYHTELPHARLKYRREVARGTRCCLDKNTSTGYPTRRLCRLISIIIRTSLSAGKAIGVADDMLRRSSLRHHPHRAPLQLLIGHASTSTLRLGRRASGWILTCFSRRTAMSSSAAALPAADQASTLFTKLVWMAFPLLPSRIKQLFS